MKTKTCTNSNCPEENPQSLSNFGQSCQTKDGLFRRCKTCRRQHYQRWAKTKKGKESIRKARARYRKTDKNRAAQRRYLETEKGKEKHREASKRYRARYREKCKARKAVAYAIEKGQLSTIETQACAECGKIAQEYHHHKGYNQEHWLDVIPLCAMCHRTLD